MGGDEFVVILNCPDMEYLKETLKRIKRSLEEYKRNSRKSVEINCSIGADMYDSSCNSIELF